MYIYIYIYTYTYEYEYECQNPLEASFPQSVSADLSLSAALCSE